LAAFFVCMFVLVVLSNNLGATKFSALEAMDLLEDSLDLDRVRSIISLEDLRDLLPDLSRRCASRIQARTRKTHKNIHYCCSLLVLLENPPQGREAHRGERREERGAGSRVVPGSMMRSVFDHGVAWRGYRCLTICPLVLCMQDQDFQCVEQHQIR
jgi:hypothetical protein